MQQERSPIIHSQVQKRKAKPTKQLKLQPEISMPITYTFTEEFSLWQHPWTLAYLCKQTALDILKPHVKNNSAAISEKKYFATGTGNAKIFAEAIVGIQHRQAKINLPCQDAVKASLQPRPILVLCDGAGSAAVSEIGSTALTSQLTRLCQSIEPMIASYLDENHHRNLKTLVRVIIRHAIGTLEDLAKQHRRSIRDFRSTLNFVIVGIERILWIKIGDGEIIQESLYQTNIQQKINAQYRILGGQNKGEFANQTQFIDDQLILDDEHWGILDTKTTTGLALMSDGTSEKMVSTQRNQVAGQLGQWLQHLRDDQLKVIDVYKRFYSEDFLNRSTGDDRSICLYSQSFDFLNTVS